MGSNKITVEDVYKKIEYCYEILSSSECTDKMYILFVVAELFKNMGALIHIEDGIHPNGSALINNYSFGTYMLNYRNSFVHIDCLNELLLTRQSLIDNRDIICEHLVDAPQEVYIKVYNALS
jgi:hypothetical protein